ncbi:hypothetical protein Hamer_G012781 [Homarus americanus]|uniref:Uncharacterized protein n=1 Tax=Homarus americanus TaxID=6706 RepID=A0A8J5JM95_HOMAM|nr:hypothetical protein Hamer_G012781 [Homarus americanus]
MQTSSTSTVLQMTFQTEHRAEKEYCYHYVIHNTARNTQSINVNQRGLAVVMREYNNGVRSSVEYLCSTGVFSINDQWLVTWGGNQVALYGTGVEEVLQRGTLLHWEVMTCEQNALTHFSYAEQDHDRTQPQRTDWRLWNCLSHSRTRQGQRSQEEDLHYVEEVEEEARWYLLKQINM